MLEWKLLRRKPQLRSASPLDRIVQIGNGDSIPAHHTYDPWTVQSFCVSRSQVYRTKMRVVGCKAETVDKRVSNSHHEEARLRKGGFPGSWLLSPQLKFCSKQC